MKDKTILGKNIKYLRTSKKLTLKSVAEVVGCSESLLSKVENGRGNPSFNTLHAIATAVGTDIGTLFSPEMMQDKIVLRKSERVRVDVVGGQNGVALEYLSPHKPHNTLQAHIQIVAPGSGSSGFISHKGEEVGYVLQGILELTVEDDVYLLCKDDSFFFDSSKPHKFRNPGTEEASVIWVNTPPTF